MLYRIPLANKIGDDGNGYYNAAYSIYSILLIMSSYSLPVAVSKMVSARLAKNQYRNSVRILYAALFYGTIAGFLGFAALWFGADYFATVVIKMPYSAYALKALAPTIWVMAYLGVLRGYFQGHSTMIPTAVSQIFEQIVNAVISIVAAASLFDLGVKSNPVSYTHLPQDAEADEMIAAELENYVAGNQTMDQASQNMDKNLKAKIGKAELEG